MSNLIIQTDDEHFAALVKATNKENPKQADLEALREFLRTRPHIWKNVGNLSRNVENRLFESSGFQQECFKLKLKQMRDDLGFQTSSELEKMLIEQVCLNWLRLNLLESIHLTKTTESHNTETGLYWDKRLTTAQKRFTRATETLAKVRKMIAQTQAKGAEMYKNLLQAEKEFETR